jgi:hypothetical protein
MHISTFPHVKDGSLQKENLSAQENRKAMITVLSLISQSRRFV